MDTIRFYRSREAYGWCSNYARRPIRLAGLEWPTTEHFYQAQKFHGTEREEAIRCAPSPGEAKRLGRDGAHPLRSDWEGVKADVMLRALRAKFTQHADLADLLLGTGESRLVEHTPHDSVWADGGDGSGQNLLGTLLQEVRSEVKDSRAHGERWQPVLMPDTRWACFFLGTVVCVPDPSADVIQYARAKLEEAGPVVAGSDRAWFHVNSVSDEFGWVVETHDEEVFSRVPRHAISDPTSDVGIGFEALYRRDMDTDLMAIVHVRP